MAGACGLKYSSYLYILTLCRYEYFQKTTVTTIEETVTVKTDSSEEESLVKVAPKDIGKLDMVIAFDTTGSMAQ